MPATRQPSWTSIREAVLVRDCRRCRECGKACSSAEADVHHLLPRHRGGSDDPANLITLCDGCHAAHHPLVQATLARTALLGWAARLIRWLDGTVALPDGAERLEAALRLLGKSDFRDGQLEVVLAALRGESVLMVSPTGSGKSLCFQVPALLRAGPTVVLSPLKALMQDQVSALTRLKVPATFLNSGVGRDERALRHRLLEIGAIKLLYLAPERFAPARVGEAEAARLRGLRPAFLVVDEAHCIDRWGDGFRPSYAALAEVREALGAPPVLAFTATAGTEVQSRILASLGVPDARVVVTDVDRPNIALFRAPNLDDYAKLGLVAALLRIRHGGRTMIFVPTRKVGTRLAARLRVFGMAVPFYHAKLPDWERDSLQQRFSGREDPALPTLICTNAFGMGLDVPDVRLVVHWAAPASLEDYAQEFGRAGRDGRPAVAVLLGGRDDAGLHAFMLERTLDALRADDEARGAARELEDIAAAKRRQIDAMIAAAVETETCFRARIRRYFEDPSRGRAGRPRSWGTRLLEWLLSRLLGRRRRHVERTVCCDACSRMSGSGLPQHVQAVLVPPTA